MIKLLGLRVSALLIRPLVILIEGLIVSRDYVLVFAIPIAMMALTISSIPVHREYYQAHAPAGPQALRYSSGLGTIMLVGFATLAALLHLPEIAMSGVLISATAFLFLVEKLADEVSRFFEFRKKFASWFLTQIVRSGWLVLPIFAAQAGFNYQWSFLVACFLSAAVFLMVFIRVTGLVPFPRKVGLIAIRTNFVFLSGASLMASQRQVPRILVTRLFPEFAHVYLAMAQLAQGCALIFNVQYQIPYRKLIARKTRLFQKIKHPLMIRILAIPAVMAPIYIFVLPNYLTLSSLSTVQLVAILMPVLIADALASAVLVAHLGYLTWCAERRAAFITYVLAASLPVASYLIVQVTGIEPRLTILSIPGIAIVTAIMWVVLVMNRHFRAYEHRRRLC